MTDKEREDFEWASGFYLYDDLDDDGLIGKKKNFLKRLQN